MALLKKPKHPRKLADFLNLVQKLAEETKIGDVCVENLEIKILVETVEGTCIRLWIQQQELNQDSFRDDVADIIYNLSEIVSYYVSKTSEMEEKIAELKKHIQNLREEFDSWEKINTKAAILDKIASECQAELKRILLMGTSIYNDMEKYSINVIRDALFKSSAALIPGDFQFDEADYHVAKQNWERLNGKVKIDHQLLAKIKLFKKPNAHTSFNLYSSVEEAYQQLALSGVSLLKEEQNDVQSLIDVLKAVKAL